MPVSAAQISRAARETAYNASPFLAEALDSVLAQDLQDFELPLVNDESTDGSSQIALDYAKRHERKPSFVR